MNPQIDIELFLSFKNNINCMNLDHEILNSMVDSISNNEHKNKKYKIQQNKKIKNIFKNPKIRLIKDKINNKINLILNKLTENNIDNLIFEFIENVKITNIYDYNEFLKTIYYKILSEINFIKIYLDFFTIITEIYKTVYDYNIEFFYDLIENKFKLDYENIIDDNFIFLTEFDDENKRINNIILINDLIKLNYFDSNFKNYIENNLLNQTKYLSDISIWFKYNKFNDEQIIKIKNIIITSENLRDKILLENLINGNSNKLVFKKQNVVNQLEIDQSGHKYEKASLPHMKVSKCNGPTENNYGVQKNNYMKVVKCNGPIEDKSNNVQQVNTEVKKNNNIELSNILEEYLFIDNTESIENYIEINCNDAITKNKFCEFIISEAFKLFNDEYKKILVLLKILIKKRILFKSNLSRGLLNIYSTKTMNSDKLKNFLIFLKNLGITKGLENIMKKFNIDV